MVFFSQELRYIQKWVFFVITVFHQENRWTSTSETNCTLLLWSVFHGTEYNYNPPVNVLAMSSAHSPTFPSLHYVTAHSPTLPSLYLRHSSFSIPSVASLRHSSFSDPSFASPTSQLILQAFGHFTYVTAHLPTLPSLYLRHSSFSNPSFASPTSQALHLIHLASRPWYL